MKRKVMAALLLGMVCVTGCSGNAEKETTAETETAATEAQSETTAETEAAAERPDYTALDYVTLGEYKGLAVTLESVAVTEEEIDVEVKTLLSDSGKQEELTEGTVEEGDVANIDYEGKKDGVAFDGGTATGYDLTIGSGSFIDGFEDGLVGVAVGETVDLNLTFPENYSSADLAGQDVVFTVTVNSIKRTPELTDEVAAEISDYETAAEYRDHVKETLVEQKKSDQENYLLNDLVTLAYENSTVNDYPQEMIDYQMNKALEYYEYYAEMYGMEFADFVEQQIGMTEEDFKEALTEDIKSMLDSELVLRAIAETEGLEVSDEEYQAGVEKYAAQMGMTDLDEFVAQYGEAEIRISVLQDKAVEILRENAVITDPDAAEEAETQAE